MTVGLEARSSGAIIREGLYHDTPGVARPLSHAGLRRKSAQPEGRVPITYPDQDAGNDFAEANTNL